MERDGLPLVPQITVSPNYAHALDQQHTQASQKSRYKRGPPNQLATPPWSSHTLRTTPSHHCACTDVLECHGSPPFFTFTPSSSTSRPCPRPLNFLVQPLSNGRGLYFSPVVCHVLHLASLLRAHFHTFSFQDVVLFSVSSQAAMPLFEKIVTRSSSCCFFASMKLSIWSMRRIQAVNPTRCGPLLLPSCAL